MGTICWSPMGPVHDKGKIMTWNCRLNVHAWDTRWWMFNWQLALCIHNGSGSGPSHAEMICLSTIDGLCFRLGGFDSAYQWLHDLEWCGAILTEWLGLVLKVLSTYVDSLRCLIMQGVLVSHQREGNEGVGCLWDASKQSHELQENPSSQVFHSTPGEGECER